MMKSKLTQLLFVTAFVELVAPSCRRSRQGAKAHGRNPALICSLNGWPTAVHLKGPATMAVVGGKLRVCRLLAHFLHGAMSGLSPGCASNRTSPHRYTGLSFRRTA